MSANTSDDLSNFGLWYDEYGSAETVRDVARLAWDAGRRDLAAVGMHESHFDRAMKNGEIARERAGIIEAQSAELASLRARCDAAEKDAERYRWLRDGIDLSVCITESFPNRRSWLDTPTAIDEYIDTAITAERAKEGETRK